jgi:hypothetical protein
MGVNGILLWIDIGGLLALIGIAVCPFPNHAPVALRWASVVIYIAIWPVMLGMLLTGLFIGAFRGSD